MCRLCDECGISRILDLAPSDAVLASPPTRWPWHLASPLSEESLTYQIHTFAHGHHLEPLAQGTPCSCSVMLLGASDVKPVHLILCEHVIDGYRHRVQTIINVQVNPISLGLDCIVNHSKRTVSHPMLGVVAPLNVSTPRTSTGFLWELQLCETATLRESWASMAACPLCWNHVCTCVNGCDLSEVTP